MYLLHEWWVFMVNVGKYTSSMDPMGIPAGWPGKVSLFILLMISEIPSLSLNSLLRPAISWGKRSIGGGPGPLDSHDTRHLNQSGDKPGFFPLRYRRECLIHFWPEKGQESNITTRTQMSNEKGLV